MPEQMNKADESVLLLAKYGLDPESIATLVEQPVSEIRATLVTHRSKIPKPDEELRTEARAFMRLALRRAMLFMEFGLPSQQLQLIRTVLPSAMRSLGAADSGESEDTHSQLQVLFSEIRSVPQPNTNGPIDVESSPAPQATDDQDQIFGDPSV